MLASAPFMPDGLVLVIALLFMLVGALYASVGHAGASGYLALMAIMGVDALVMRPTALTLNVLVGTIAFVQFARAGHFRWRLFWPFAVASVPMAYVGGAAHVPAGALKVAIGVVLLLTACRMVWTNLRPRPETEAPLRAMPLPAALVCGGVIGLVAGLTGTGGGIFLSPLILLFRWADTKQTAAAAALFVLINSVAGLSGMAASGWTPHPSLALLAVAAGIGGLVGSYIGSRRATPRGMCLALAAVLLLAGGKLVLQ